MNEGQKVTLKPEIPIVSWMTSETHSNWMVSPIIRWKFCTGSRCLGMQEEGSLEQGASFPLGLTETTLAFWKFK